MTKGDVKIKFLIGKHQMGCIKAKGNLSCILRRLAYSVRKQKIDLTYINKIEITTD